MRTRKQKEPRKVRGRMFARVAMVSDGEPVASISNKVQRLVPSEVIREGRRSEHERLTLDCWRCDILASLIQLVPARVCKDIKAAFDLFRAGRRLLSG